MLHGIRRGAEACAIAALAAALAAPACAPRRGPETAPRPPAADRPLERGIASWYGQPFHGRRTASGERFDMHQLTAAHRTLPFGTRVEVRNLENGRTVVVRINDRGPSVSGRIIDLSYAAARRLGLLEDGLADVALYRVR